MAANAIKERTRRIANEKVDKQSQKQSLPKVASEETSQSSVEATLQQRGQVYGSFKDNSTVALDLLNVVLSTNSNRIQSLQPWELNALIMICEKMSRILTGKSHEDNWIDIAGYAELGRNPR